MRPRTARLCGPFIAFIPVALGSCLGCGPTQPPAIQPDKTSVTITKPLGLLQVDGPGGRLSLGGTIADAKKAFPRPGGAEGVPGLSENAETWAWENDEMLFEAVGTEGKLAWFVLMHKGLDINKRDGEISRELDRFGEPAENAESKYAAAYSWEKDDAVRVVVNIGAPGNEGVLTVVGRARMLIDKGFPIGELSILVYGIDEAAKETAANK
ncbi:MAG: hypothetical protein ACR2HJ_03470 [Fimbriimonadales bacterium]